MHDPGTDKLSPLAHDLLKAAEYRKLVVTGGTPSDAWKALASVTPDQLLAVPVTSWPHAHAMLAGLWLWHDALHESHEIAQKSPNDLLASARNPHSKGSQVGLNVRSVECMEADKGPSPQQLRDAEESLSFWHAIMHRREGDFSNAKYWYARCQNHPVLQSMVPFAADVIHQQPADKFFLRLVARGWDPDVFVDLAEHLRDRPADPRYAAATALQRIEWRLLFDHCTRAATGQ